MNDMADLFSLDGQVALITGAGRGIGAEIAQTLGAAGAIVLGADISGIDDISEYLEERSIKGRGLTMDVSSPESIAEAQADIAEKEGTVSILVNNAGITRDNLLMRMKDEEWEDLMRINLSSMYYVSKAFLRSMMKARSGRIINIASVVGVMGNAGQSNYGAAKAGVIGFSKSLAKEVGARGITVNAVAGRNLFPGRALDIFTGGLVGVDRQPVHRRAAGGVLLRGLHHYRIATLTRHSHFVAGGDAV